VDRTFGHIAGFPPGSTFESRKELAASGVHRPLRAGISGSQHEGADSVVLSGGYEDDDDRGDTILYTGEGGRDAETGEQARPQMLSRGNLALARSCALGLPVRVVRGGNNSSPHSPADGSYRYDGLYRVAEFWQQRGQRGHWIWRFRLERVRSDESI
jgi:putative restriction endonuclease